MSELSEIAARIRELREICEYSQEELAKELNIDLETYKQYEETGSDVPISFIYQIAKKFNVSKSTVHKDLQERLYDIDKNLHIKIVEIFKNHIEIRHIKGGESTRKRYLKLKEG